MNRVSSGECLSAVFVDYDNIYLSLKRKNEEAAKQFSKDTGGWLKELESGRLITPTNGLPEDYRRRLVMSRCYGNPVPRRNSRDNSTDMNSFPFVRHHFLRSGFEIIDCPPLTAQLKNSSDIRMVMDIRDFLDHETYFDEFIILSGDADFTPVLHRLRSHARRTIIFANDYTATPYTAICDGEIRESDLIDYLLEGKLPQPDSPSLQSADDEDFQNLARAEIVEEVMQSIKESDEPVPIAFLADRAQRSLGHEKTIGSNWAGFGAFRTFLISNLPEEFHLTDSSPYYAYDPKRHSLTSASDVRMDAIAPPEIQQLEPPEKELPDPDTDNSETPLPPSLTESSPSVPQSPSTDLQQSIARIHDACQAPPIAPPDYRALFGNIAKEISENGLSGGQTITGIVNRMAQDGIEISREDAQFVLDVISEADPWFEQGASASLFAGRFRNFVISKCRNAGLSLTAEELDLIDAWFAGGHLQKASESGSTAGVESSAQPPRPPASVTALADQIHQERIRQREDNERLNTRTMPSLPNFTENQKTTAEQSPQLDPLDIGQFPRIIRSRMRG